MLRLQAFDVVGIMPHNDDDVVCEDSCEHNERLLLHVAFLPDRCCLSFIKRCIPREAMLSSMVLDKANALVALSASVIVFKICLIVTICERLQLFRIRDDAVHLHADAWPSPSRGPRFAFPF